MSPISTAATGSAPLVRPIEADVQLLVEGKGPEGFFEALIEHLKLEKNLQIQDFHGVKELKTFLPALRKTSDFSRVTSVGIVRDAAKSATGALKSVQGCLKHANLPVPDTTGQRVGDDPAVTVMILPGGAHEKGMLETLLCETFNEEDVRTCVDAFVGCVEELRGAYKRHRRDKARARVYLATKPHPHLSVGVAAKRQYWDLDHPVLEPLRTFLSSL